MFQIQLPKLCSKFNYLLLKIIHNSILTPKYRKIFAKNNLSLPVEYPSSTQQLETVEPEAFQTNTNIFFMLEIQLIKQPHFIFSRFPFKMNELFYHRSTKLSRCTRKSTKPLCSTKLPIFCYREIIILSQELPNSNLNDANAVLIPLNRCDTFPAKSRIPAA